MLLAAVVLLSIAAASARADTANPSPSSDRVVIDGVGAAHGLGMAMDGVFGQAGAGWTHDRILDLFYPGTSPGRAAGTIRVWLHEAATEALTLPAGGVVSDAPPGARAGRGFPLHLGAGAHVALRATSHGTAVTVDGLPVPIAAATAQPRPVAAQAPPGLVPTPPPPPVLPPSATPKPKPTPASSRVGVAPGLVTARSIWAWGAGGSPLVAVDATGHPYRGSIEVLAADGTLRVVNHVDLETYVDGIAEEKGQGWPPEALKALAIAARSLGAATMTWFTGNHAQGYDICPTGDCQLYLGADGEEPAMREAAAETSGLVRSFGGRPILAMYHGNGGGQTESYRALLDDGSDPYPYLRSIRYPFAHPTFWHIETTMDAIAKGLSSDGVQVPNPLERVDVIKHGESPRVVKLGLIGLAKSTATEPVVPGSTFASALQLPSTWFTFRSARGTATVTTSQFGTIDTGGGYAAPGRAAKDGFRPSLAVATLCLLALALALNLKASEGAVRLVRLRALLVALRRGDASG